MTGDLETLNLEGGKSEALRAALACVTEASAADGGPRYAAKVGRELARVVVCRSYAKPMLELAHLLVAASGPDGRFENVLWGVDRATAGAFRGAFAMLEGRRGPVRLTGDGVAHLSGGETFLVSYGRMPFLAALLEFMITAVGYADIDDLTRGLRDGGGDPDAVRDAANGLQRCLYAYLKDNLPPVQRQRREHHFLAYIEDNAGNRGGADAISDDAVLGYWCTHALDEELETRTYRGVYETATRLILALDAAAERLAGMRARSIGTDREAGEVDPADVDAVMEALDEAGPLQALLDASGDRVKFVNGAEAEAFAELPLVGRVGERLPASVFRNAVWGAVQLRFGAALRRGAGPPTEALDIGETPYRSRHAGYGEAADTCERLVLAALWPLHADRRPEAIELALALAPDLDWGALADTGGTVSINVADAVRQFFDAVPDPKGDELPALLAEARRAWSNVNRAGFRDDSTPGALDALAEAAPAALALVNAVRRFLDRDLRGIEWTALEHADPPVFADMFERLYPPHADKNKKVNADAR